MSNQENSFVGFEYLEVCAKRGMESMYVDSYHSFGWVYEGTSDPENGSGAVTLQFKRDRRLRSSAELTRLQHHRRHCGAYHRSGGHRLPGRGNACLSQRPAALGDPSGGSGPAGLDHSVFLLSEDLAAQDSAGRPPHRAENR